METFSKDEVEFLQQAVLFDWKERITHKIKRVFETLHQELASILDPETLAAPPGMDFAKWQVVRGERYHNLPYAYLDFPQFFTRETKFTYRSMFWWGSGFVFAWILEGPALAVYRENLLAAYDALADRGIVLSLADTPWEWRQNGPQNLRIQGHNRPAVADALDARPFLKLQSFLEFGALAREEGVIIRRAVETFEVLRPVVSRGEAKTGS